jgi:hypothetical protein
LQHFNKPSVTFKQNHKLLKFTEYEWRSAPTPLVFPNKSCEPLRESKPLERVLQPAAERAGLGRVTWHQFRHIDSSLLNVRRVPVKIAQEQLGTSAFPRR